MITVPMNVSAATVEIKMGINAGVQDVPIGMGTSYSMTTSTDYELLINKPQICGVELIGNKLLADLFPDGIIINGGNCEGYDEPIVPPGVPYAEGVGF